MKQVATANLHSFFEQLASLETLYLPVKNEVGQSVYTRWYEGAVYSTALNTARSAKDFFLPQVETLMEFRVNGKAIEVIDHRVEHDDFVVFGVRACDAKSFEVLDKVYLADPVDTFYQNRRKHGTVITVACTKPTETCFCTAFGIDPTSPAGDISAWMTDDTLYLEANTEKGAALLEKLDLEEAKNETEVEVQKETTKAVLEKLPLAKLSPDAFRGERMMEIFSDPKWKELSEACLACGTCTFVCPTCQCYDVRDFDTGSGIERFRCWDSCMYSDFTQMSAGQPRTTQLERFRQRFMHKLVYQPMNNGGTYGCVGCGRCLAKCPIHMNIVKVMKAIGGNN